MSTCQECADSLTTEVLTQHGKLFAPPDLKELLYFFSQGTPALGFICQACHQFQEVKRLDSASSTTFVCTCKHHSLIDWQKGILHTGSYYLQEY